MKKSDTYTLQWATGTVAPRKLRHRIPRTIFGYRCGVKTITKTTKERQFDTRKGDTLPRRHLKEVAAGYAGSFLLTRVYIYPGEEVEVPNFAHATGRRQLRSTQTLMASIVPVGVCAVPLPMSQVTVIFDAALSEPIVEISYFMRRGFMIFDGPQGFDVKLYFRDQVQQREYCHEFAPPAEVADEIAA